MDGMFGNDGYVFNLSTRMRMHLQCPFVRRKKTCMSPAGREQHTKKGKSQTLAHLVNLPVLFFSSCWLYFINQAFLIFHNVSDYSLSRLENNIVYSCDGLGPDLSQENECDANGIVIG